jgi:hypothetical protein
MPAPDRFEGRPFAGMADRDEEVASYLKIGIRSPLALHKDGKPAMSYTAVNAY